VTSNYKFDSNPFGTFTLVVNLITSISKIPKPFVSPSSEALHINYKQIPKTGCFNVGIKLSKPLSKSIFIAELASHSGKITLSAALISSGLLLKTALNPDGKHNTLNISSPVIYDYYFHFIKFGYLLFTCNSSTYLFCRKKLAVSAFLKHSFVLGKIIFSVALYSYLDRFGGLKIASIL
jgi:hypothetical protein